MNAKLLSVSKWITRVRVYTIYLLINNVSVFKKNTRDEYKIEVSKNVCCINHAKQNEIYNVKLLLFNNTYCPMVALNDC